MVPIARNASRAWLNASSSVSIVGTTSPIRSRSQILSMNGMKASLPAGGTASAWSASRHAALHSGFRSVARTSGAEAPQQADPPPRRADQHPEPAPGPQSLDAVLADPDDMGLAVGMDGIAHLN